MEENPQSIVKHSPQHSYRNSLTLLITSNGKTPSHPDQEEDPTDQTQATTHDQGISNQINDVLEQVRRQTPSDIQRIMVEQLKVGTRYYEEAARQSAKSFELSRITTICSAALFAISVIAAIFVPSSWYVPVTGTVLSTIIHSVGQFSYLHNRASEQLGNFHKFLDHISRSLFAYTMGRDANDADSVKRAIDQMLSSSDLLKK